MKRSDIERVLALMPRSHWTGEGELRRSLMSVGPTLGKHLARAAFAVGKEAGQAEVHQRIDNARERITTLEKYLGEHLQETGACSDAGDYSDYSLCESPACTYCQMARALQPTICGMPLEASNADSNHG